MDEQKKIIPELTKAELEIMQVVWQIDDNFVVRDVHERLPGGHNGSHSGHEGFSDTQDLRPQQCLSGGCEQGRVHRFIYAQCAAHVLRRVGEPIGELFLTAQVDFNGRGRRDSANA